MHKGLFANAMTFVYVFLSFFIPSSSVMAVLTMLIISPLADGVGVGREVVVNAYQFGIGLFNFINPTGLNLASLAIVKVGFNKWLKFVVPLVIILTIVTMLFMRVSMYINYAIVLGPHKLQCLLHLINLSSVHGCCIEQF